MKKIIRILFVCLFFIALIFIGKNVLKDGKEREYIKSDKYYEENIENININEVNFKFLQVNEVANVNEAFYKKYDSYKEVVVEDNKNYDVFEKYTKVDVAFDQGYSGMRCYLNEDESFGGAYFRYTFEYETNDENLVDSSIEVYITAEPLEKFEGLLPTIEEADDSLLADNIYTDEELKAREEYFALYNKLMSAGSDMTDEEYEQLSDELELYEENYKSALAAPQRRTYSQYQDQLDALYEEKRILKRILKDKDVYENVTESVTFKVKNTPEENIDKKKADIKSK